MKRITFENDICKFLNANKTHDDAIGGPLFCKTSRQGITLETA